MRSLTALALALVCSACSAGGQRRTTCDEVCAREGECLRGREPEVVWDVGECVEACAEVSLAPATRALAQAHLGCVTSAATCAEVRACQ